MYVGNKNYFLTNMEGTYIYRELILFLVPYLDVSNLKVGNKGTSLVPGSFFF